MGREHAVVVAYLDTDFEDPTLVRLRDTIVSGYNPDPSDYRRHYEVIAEFDHWALDTADAYNDVFAGFNDGSGCELPPFRKAGVRSICEGDIISIDRQPRLLEPQGYRPLSWRL